MDYSDPLTILVLAIGAGFAPGIYWLVYFYKKDWYEPEPKWLVLKAFFWGMLCSSYMGPVKPESIAFFTLLGLILSSLREISAQDRSL